MAKQEFLSCRVEADTKERFKEIAKDEKREPSELLRMMVEDRVEREKPAKRRQHAMSK